MFLHRICTICLFIFLTCNANSEHQYKWQTKELEDNISFPLNCTSLKSLIEPLSYNIYLNTIFEKNYDIFIGDIDIFFIIEYPTRQINLNAHRLTIREKEFIHFYRFPYKGSYEITNLSYLSEKGLLILDFKTEIPSGYYIIEMIYTGHISENEVGLYRTICKDCTGALKRILVTQLKPTPARRVFPCWDDPVFRTRFAIQIEHHRNYISLSNMPIRKQLTINDDIMETKFHSTPPIPAYLVAFVLTDFVCSTNDQVNFTTRVCSTSLVKQEQMTFALNTSVYVTTYMHNYTRMSPQLREITHIGLQDFSYKAAGNWGFNIYGENHLIYNETLHPIEHKLDVWMYMSSLVALQWVGNLVSPTSWTHMWFSQTLALFYAVKAFNQMYDDKDISSLFSYRLQSLARENHVVSQVKPVVYSADNHDEIDRLIKTSHFTNCLKEYAIIAMLENTVTKSIFKRAIITYLEKYQFSTATPNDFWNILQDMIEKKGDHTHPSIERVVQHWLKQTSLPVIRVMRNHIDDYNDKIIIKSQYMSRTKSGFDVDHFIPVNYVTTAHPKNISSIMWLDTHDVSHNFRVQISHLECVIVNWQYTGYYHVKYDTRSLKILQMCLQSKKRTKINVLNRAHIIEDAYYFWKKQKIHANMFINLTNFVWDEKQCAPWYAMENVIRKMWRFLNMDVGTRVKSVILRGLNNLLEVVGYEEHHNDTECVRFKRLLATRWACRLFHPPCLKIAQKRLIEHLEDPEINIISPIWEEWTYCNGLVLSDRWIWSRVFKEYQRTKNKRILIYLACSKDNFIIRDYFELAILNNSFVSNIFVLNSEDRQNIYRYIVKKHISKNEMLNFVLENIKQMEIDDFIEKIRYIIENVYSKHQLEKILSSLLEKNVHIELLEELKFKLRQQYLNIRSLKQLKK